MDTRNQRERQWRIGGNEGGVREIENGGNAGGRNRTKLEWHKSRIFVVGVVLFIGIGVGISGGIDVGLKRIREFTDNKDGTFSIPLTQGLISIVDAEDVPNLAGYNWCAARIDDHLVYAQRNIPKEGGGKTVLKMHRVIMGIDGPFVDHIDGDGLNNQRSNLRHVTPKQNRINTRPAKKNSTGYKGVHKECEKWEAQVSIDRGVVHLGTFSNPEEAARVYDLACIFYFGNYARPNFPRDQYPIAITEEMVMSNVRPEESLRGSAVYCAKLTEGKVRDIKQRMAKGEKGAHLAREYGISPSVIYRIRDGQDWRHVK